MYVAALIGNYYLILKVGICLVHVPALEDTSSYCLLPEQHYRSIASVCATTKK